MIKTSATLLLLFFFGAACNNHPEKTITPAPVVWPDTAVNLCHNSECIKTKTGCATTDAWLAIKEVYTDVWCANEDTKVFVVQKGSNCYRGAVDYVYVSNTNSQMCLDTNGGTVYKSTQVYPDKVFYLAERGVCAQFAVPTPNYDLAFFTKGTEHVRTADLACK